MKIDQRIKANDLIAQGFKVYKDGRDLIASKNNDHRIIWRDGSVHRAEGAKR
jgi:hypothetical protein